MKSAVLALAVSVLLVAPAFAQDASPPPGGPPPAGDAGGPGPGPGDGGGPGGGGGGGGGKGGKMKEAVAACRSEVQAQGVKGPDRKKAIMDCVTKEHPEFAGRMQCRQDGMAKGLSGDDLKSFVRSCVRGHG